MTFDLAVVALTCKILFGLYRMLSGEYYGFHFVTPLPQCVERFYCYRSNEINITASLLRFAGHINNHNVMPGEYFWPHFEKQDNRHRRFFDFQQGLLVAL